MVKAKGLGRGLDALLAGEDDATTVEARIAELAIDQLRPGRFQPRTRMDPESIAELADSIKAQGVIQPILVRPGDGGQYEIIAGERRWRASRMAGLDRVPVTIRDVPDDLAMAMALIENIQREDLNPLEEAQGIQRLISEFGMTHESAAAAVGRSRSGVSNLLRLLMLAKPVQELMLHGKLDMGHGRALLALAGARQIETANAIALKGLSVREAEDLVRRALAAPRQHRAKTRDRDVVALEHDLSDRLGTRVSIRPRGRKGAGRIIIDYAGLDQLDELLARLR